MRFKPFLVLSLRLGQGRRLWQAGWFPLWRGHFYYARHSLGSSICWQGFIEI
jgi:hypothetical protein